MCSETYCACIAIKSTGSVKHLADNVADCGTVASSSVLSADAKEFIPSVVPVPESVVPEPELTYYSYDVRLYYTAD